MKPQTQPLPIRRMNALDPASWVSMAKLNGQGTVVVPSDVQKMEPFTPPPGPLFEQQNKHGPYTRLVFDVDQDGESTESIVVRGSVDAVRATLNRHDL